MEQALEIERGIERLVSAEEIKREYHGNIPRRIHFICPFCRQPLIVCSMKERNLIAPYFKHEKNNEIAHECELYASNTTFVNAYHRMPMPIYIRRSGRSESEFIIELGFKQLDRKLVEELEAEGACLEIGRKQYNITMSRFGDGAIRLPIDAPALNISAQVRLTCCHSNLFITWGRPEDSRTAMVFSADLDTLCGKRINYCDGIVYGSQLMVVIPETEKQGFKKAATEAVYLGTVKSSSRRVALSVYSVVVPAADGYTAEFRAYFEHCGYSFTEGNQTPEIIWPPSLMTSDEFEPIFNSKKFLFVKPSCNRRDSLYLHQLYDTDKDVRYAPFIRAIGGSGGFAIVERSNQMQFASLHNEVSSAAVILVSRENIANRLPDGSSFKIEHEVTDSLLAKFKSPFSCVVVLLDHKNNECRHADLSADEAREVPINSDTRIVIVRPLRGSSGCFPVWRHEPDLASDPVGNGIAANLESKVKLLRLGFPAGKRNALARRESLLNAHLKRETIPKIRKGRRS